MKKRLLVILLSLPFYVMAQKGWKPAEIRMPTRWSKEVSPKNALPEYPRPQMVRNLTPGPSPRGVEGGNWQNLNGLWQYAITLRHFDKLSAGSAQDDIPKKWDGQILVPYPLESALSGVEKGLLPDQLLWYKRTFSPLLISPNGGEKPAYRILLHFGAVDWQATVYVNGQEVGEHKGGYTAFSFDITDYIKNGNNELAVKVYDPTDQGYQPHGKQVLTPGNIYYTPTSGIWQTVWMEVVPATYIQQLTITPNIDKGFVHVLAGIESEAGSIQTEATVWFKGKLIANERRSSNSIGLDIPNARLWSPDTPNLYTLRVRLFKNSRLVDEVTSYFGMRKIEIKKDGQGFDRIFLNNKYTYNLGVLDQGFWPDGLYTAPTDAALAFDIKTIKAMGFNTIRKHIKVEPARWYYYADKLGMMVWQDFVNPNQGLPAGAKEEFEKESKEIMDQLHNHPSITTWVLFNERWGAYDQKRLTEWVKEYDPTRLANGHSGQLLYVNDRLRAPATNPYASSDLVDYHSYPEPMEVKAIDGKASVLGEYGGIGVPVPYHEWNDLQGWGYVQVTATELKNKYEAMTNRLQMLEREGLSGSIYTQPFDVEGEENGLLTYDREVIKIPVTEIRKINSRLVEQTKGFDLDPRFFIARNIDVGDNDSQYRELLTAYNKGKKDSAVLRRLSLMALRQQDQNNLTRLSNSYLKELKQPFSRDNLSFFKFTTRTSKDKAFELFVNEPKKVNAVLGLRQAEGKIINIINLEEISPYITKEPINWDAIQKRVTDKYHDIGERMVLGKRIIYYWGKQDWLNLGKYYKAYYEKYLPLSDLNINNLTWAVFENVNDATILKFATGVAKINFEKYDNTAEALDTYANLLYKTGKTDEAIQVETKAATMSGNQQSYLQTIEKMKKGEPTWKN
jgi:hypothetical protein